MQGVDAAVLWPTFTVSARGVKPEVQGELELLEVGENGVPEEKAEEKEEEELKKKEAKNSEYFKIPHLKYEFESHSIPKISLGECKETCDEKKGEGGKPECKSFSFNEQTNECLWSEEAFYFNPGWVYYSKEKKGQYRAIPGLKYQTVQGKKDSEQTTAMDCPDECDKDFKCLGYGYSSITKQCVEAYEGAEFKPNQWPLYLKPAPKHDSAQMLYLAKKKIPELKAKAFEQHKSRHGDEYAERKSKEHTEKARVQAEKEEKAFAERTEKEVVQKKKEAEAAVKKEEEKTNKVLEKAEKKKLLDAKKCAAALKKEREVDEVAHTCKVSQDDAEAAAETAKGEMDHAQQQRATANTHEASAKSQASSGENEEQLKTTAENMKNAEDKVVATEKDFDEKTKGAQAAAEKCPPLEAELAVAKKEVEETGALCKETKEKAEEGRTAERESKFEAKEMDKKAARRKEMATKHAEEKVVKAQEQDVKLK